MKIGQISNIYQYCKSNYVESITIDHVSINQKEDLIEVNWARERSLYAAMTQNQPPKRTCVPLENTEKAYINVLMFRPS